MAADKGNIAAQNALYKLYQNLQKSAAPAVSLEAAVSQNNQHAVPTDSSESGTETILPGPVVHIIPATETVFKMDNVPDSHTNAQVFADSDSDLYGSVDNDLLNDDDDLDESWSNIIDHGKKAKAQIKSAFGKFMDMLSMD